MPVVPFKETSPGAVPNTGGSQPHVDANLQVPRPSTEAFAAGAVGQGMIAQGAATEAAAFNRLGDVGQQFADKYIEQKLNVDAANAGADLSKQLLEAQFESSKIPDRAKATQDFDARVQKIQDNFATADVNPFIRNRVAQRLPEQIVLRRAATQAEAFNGESQKQRGDLITQLDGWNKMAADASDPRLRDSIIAQANDAIDGRVAGGWMRADQAAEMKVGFKSNVLRTQVELLMAKDTRLGVALAGVLLPQMNSKDARDIGIMTEDRKKQLEAEQIVNDVLPPMGGGLDNNIGNITKSAAQYAGGKTGPSGPFETFQTPEHGAAAAYGLIKTKVDQNGGSLTFTQLIGGNSKVGGWAPEDNGSDPMLKGNKVAPYAQRLAQSVGLSASDPIPIGDDEKMAKILKAMNQHEKGKQTIGDEKFVAGIKLAKGDQSAVAMPTGDELNAFRTNGLRRIQELEANTTLDPRVKAQAISLLSQRLRTTESLVLSDRKQTDDEGETAAIGLFTGKYKDGTFQALADKYRASGDNSKAAIYDVLASQESLVKDFANAPPGAQRTLGTLLPGAAGKIATSIIADRRTDRTEFRRLGAEQERIFNEALTSGADPQTTIANAREAIQYYAAAGDVGKANSLVEQFQGALKGHQMAMLPPAEREALVNEFKELAQSPSGLSVRDAAVIKQIQRGQSAANERWQNDPLAQNNDRGGIKLQPFNQQMDPTNLAMWAQKRYQDTVKTALDKNPYATNLAGVTFFTQAEMSSLTGQLATQSVQQQQFLLAKLGATVPQQALGTIGQQMSKNDVQSDAWATAMAFYGRGKPGDREIADSLIVGADLLAKGGKEGKMRVDFNKDLVPTISSELGAARAGMTGEQLSGQDNAIAARYVALMAGTKDPMSVNSTVMSKAIKDVVGTAMTRNGGAFLIPKEIEPYQFRDGIAALTAGDVPTAKAPVATRGQFEAAQRDLALSPQESALYERHLSNLGGPGGVDNKDGSRSTLYALTANIDGKEYIIPTVQGGKIMQPKEAIEAAKAEGLGNFPSYATAKEAEDRYQKLHQYMERDTSDFLRQREAATGMVTAEKVKQYATFRTVGDGLYWVYMPDPKRGGTSEVLDPNTGRPWVLDIRTLVSRTGGPGANYPDPLRSGQPTTPTPVPLARPRQ